MATHRVCCELHESTWFVICGCGRLLSDAVGAAEPHLWHAKLILRSEDYEHEMGYSGALAASPQIVSKEDVHDYYRVHAAHAWRLVAQGLPFKVVIGHAYNRRDHGFNPGCDHVVAASPVSIGRLNRDAGDALCRPTAKFEDLFVPGFDAPDEGDFPSCLRCIQKAERVAGLAFDTGPRWMSRTA